MGHGLQGWTLVGSLPEGLQAAFLCLPPRPSWAPWSLLLAVTPEISDGQRDPVSGAQLVLTQTGKTGVSGDGSRL